MGTLCEFPGSFFVFFGDMPDYAPLPLRATSQTAGYTPPGTKVGFLLCRQIQGDLRSPKPCISPGIRDLWPTDAPLTRLRVQDLGFGVQGPDLHEQKWLEQK